MGILKGIGEIFYVFGWSRCIWEDKRKINKMEFEIWCLNDVGFVRVGVNLDRIL